MARYFWCEIHIPSVLTVNAYCKHDSWFLVPLLICTDRNIIITFELLNIGKLHEIVKLRLGCIVSFSMYTTSQFRRYMIKFSKSGSYCKTMVNSFKILGFCVTKYCVILES